LSKSAKLKKKSRCNIANLVLLTCINYTFIKNEEQKDFNCRTYFSFYFHAFCAANTWLYGSEGWGSSNGSYLRFNCDG
jgi:hypothetical protein